MWVDNDKTPAFDMSAFKSFGRLPSFNKLIKVVTSHIPCILFVNIDRTGFTCILIQAA